MSKNLFTTISLVVALATLNNVDGDGRPEDGGPRTTRLREPGAATYSTRATPGSRNDGDKAIFDISPLVETSFGAGCTPCTTAHAGGLVCLPPFAASRPLGRDAAK
jgi:hypothetical protein